MQPNKKENSVFLQCECHGHHFLEIQYDKDDLDDGIWFSFIDYPNTLWQSIKWWWSQKKMWSSELEMNREDVKDVIKFLNKYLKESKKDNVLLDAVKFNKQFNNGDNLKVNTEHTIK